MICAALVPISVAEGVPIEVGDVPIVDELVGLPVTALVISASLTIAVPIKNDSRIKSLNRFP